MRLTVTERTHIKGICPQLEIVLTHVQERVTCSCTGQQNGATEDVMVRRGVLVIVSIQQMIQTCVPPPRHILDSTCIIIQHLE